MEWEVEGERQGRKGRNREKKERGETKIGGKGERWRDRTREKRNRVRERRHMVRGRRDRETGVRGERRHVWEEGYGGDTARGEADPLYCLHSLR